MRVNFIQTKLISDTMYADLIDIDGNLHTMVMEKTAEPNIFGVKEKLDGNNLDSMVAKYKES
jgi:hypothetical protein